MAMFEYINGFLGSAPPTFRVKLEKFGRSRTQGLAQMSTLGRHKNVVDPLSFQGIRTMIDELVDESILNYGVELS